MAHHATQCMAVVINLLTFPDVTGKERLVDLLVPEMPAGMKTEVFLEKENARWPDASCAYAHRPRR